MRSSAYRELFRLPAMRWQALAGLIAQLTQGAAGVGVILVVRTHTGSLALAGTVVGTLTIAAGVARPIQGRVIDRRDGRLLMLACAIAHPAALIGIVALASLHAPALVLIGLGAIAGVSLPPVSTSMRVSWGAALPASERNAAYSLVYLTQEISILAGPTVLAAVIALANPSLALIVVAVLAGAGTIGFAVSLGALPVRQAPASPHLPRGVFRSGGMRVLVANAALLGAVLGALEVGVPTIATAHRVPAASGLLIASLSLGGIAGATAYGARRWTVPPRRRLVALLSMMTAALILVVPVSNLVLIGALLALAGAALNPVLTTASVLVDSQVSAGSAAEAFGWLSSGMAAGTGAANVIAAALTHRSHAQTAFLLAAIAAAAAALLAAAAQGILRGTPGQDAQENDVRNVRSEVRV